MAFKRSTTKNTGTSAAGQVQCPECGSVCIPMGSGKGFRCSKGKAVRRGGGWETVGCPGVVWNNSRPFIPASVKVARAERFPNIKTPTPEQSYIYTLFGQSPDKRGSRCIVSNAGPGTGKTSTVSWALEAAFKRLGNLNNFPVCCFNANARDVLLGKLPAEVPDVFTLNGWGAKIQGYSFRNYDKKKPATKFKDATSHLDYEDRPNPASVVKVLERTRDLCLFSSDESPAAWSPIIAETLNRFPGMAKKVQGSEKIILDYLPGVAVACHRDGTKIDLQEQVTRPVTDAIARIGWVMPDGLASRSVSDWTPADVTHFANLVRAIKLPQVRGMIVDEAQDLSLAQIATVLAQTWQAGELVLIGDDATGTYGEPGYKAGQAIYGWRGAFGGSMSLVGRLWAELTGETPIAADLTITFRHGPEICDSYRPLNSVIQSALPAGKSTAYVVSDDQAFTAWLNLPDDQTALWITRTNAPLAPMLLATLRNHKSCCIRGGGDFATNIDTALYGAAGWYDNAGEYKVSLSDCLAGLKAAKAESEAAGITPDPNSLESFLIVLAETVLTNPAILAKADLPAEATVGNLRRFVTHFATATANRVLTTVYRCKGDEADLAIVADVARFNETWNDAAEDRACRHVALSRAKSCLMTIGTVQGSAM